MHLSTHKLTAVKGASPSVYCEQSLLRLISCNLPNFFRRVDEKEYILSTEQVNPVPAPLGLDLVVKKECDKGRGTRRKHSIVLEERTKVLKAAAHEQRPSADVKPKKESNLNTCCMKTPAKQAAKKSCQCLEGVDCDHINFQVSWA